MKQILLFLGIILPIVCQAYDFEVDGNYYGLISTSERTVRYCGTKNIQSEIIVPSKVTISNKEFSVVEIGERPFKDPRITCVTIPETFTVLSGLGESSFSTIKLPMGLKEIGSKAFSNCKNLKEINIPETVEKIGSFAFEGCTSLTKIPLHKKNLVIEYGAFSNGIRPTGCLVIPGHTSFSKRYGYKNGDIGIVFDDCSLIDSLIFEDSTGGLSLSPAKYSYWKDGTFELAHISELDYIYIGRNLENWGAEINVRKVEFGDECECDNGYVYYSSGKYLISNKFNTAKLEEIVFGKLKKEIGVYKQCKNLRKVFVRSTTPPTATTATTAEGFSNDTYIHGTLYVPTGTLNAYQNADVWKEFWNIEEFDTESGIEAVSVNGNQTAPKRFYDVNGAFLKSPKKGVNIVKYPDGTIRKVIY